MIPSPDRVIILPGLISRTSCTGRHCHYELTCATGLSCPDNTVYPSSSTVSGSSSLSASSFRMIPEPWTGGMCDIDAPFRAKPFPVPSLRADQVWASVLSSVHFQKKLALIKAKSGINLQVQSWVYREQSRVILDPFSNVIIIDSLPGARDRLCSLYLWPTLPSGFSHWFQWKFIFTLKVWLPGEINPPSSLKGQISPPSDSWCV